MDSPLLFYRIKCLCDICDQVFLVFQAETDTDQLCRNTGFDQLLIGHLTMGGGGRISAAGSCVGYVSFNCAEL